MKIITTPMCEDVLKIAGVKKYTVVKPSEIKDADVAVLLSETQSDVPKISIKLNTFSQVYDSILKIQKEFDTDADKKQLYEIKNLMKINNEKKDNRKNTKVKVYSNFLKDTLLYMGFSIDDTEYDYIIVPDYWDKNINGDKEVIVVPSHKNVSSSIIKRVKERYDLLERKICTKQ